MKKLNVESIQSFRDQIRESLDNAVVNGYAVADERPEDTADNMVELDAALEIFCEVPHLLVPYIQEWQREQHMASKKLEES